MISIIIKNVLDFDMATIGLIAGFFGTIVVTLFGVPSIPLLNKGMYIEIQITTQMKIFSWISRFGLLMIAVGFMFQLISISDCK